MSVIASSGMNENDEELFLSQKLWDKIRSKGFDNIGEKSASDESSLEEDGSEDDK